LHAPASSTTQSCRPRRRRRRLDWAETWFKAGQSRYGEDGGALLAMGRAVPATDFVRASRSEDALAAALAEVFRNQGPIYC
jgi:hypothetical protein